MEMPFWLVGDSKRAWHVGKGELHGVPTDVNGRSIGIEIVNDGSGKTPFTEAQYKSLTQLVGYLKQEYEVPTWLRSQSQGFRRNV
jgi:N-acetylmuramoyl-L-alanine amidase